MDHDSNSPVSRSLESLGYGPFFERQRLALAELVDGPRSPLRGHPAIEPARVAAGGRGVLHVLTTSGPRRATTSGRLLHDAADAAALPAVGDWVGLRPDTADTAVVTHVFARRTCLIRKAAGRSAEAQVLAANVDAVMIVSSLNADFNARRLERYLEVALEGGARPIFVLNKADLCEAPDRFVDAVRALAPAAPIVLASALADHGVDALAAHLGAGETVALVGSSGVGKSTIANRLLGPEAQAQREGAIRAHDDRGKHTTTHRELFVLPGGGLLVDTPGLRELTPWGLDEGGPAGFADVEALAARCRFRDCAHEGEPGCAVAAAVAGGELAEDRLAGFHKLAAEGRHLRDRHDARARAEARRRSKALAKVTKMSPKT